MVGGVGVHDFDDARMLMEPGPRRWKWIGGGVAAAIVVTTGIFVFHRGDDAPATSSIVTTGPETTPARQLATERPPIGMTVVLAPFAPGAPVATVGQPISMFVQVSGVSPVATVELWAGGEIVDVVEDPTRLDPTWSVKLGWKPSAEGTTFVVARGIDADGRAATSNPLTYTAVPPSAPLPIVQYETVDGDTPSAVAARFGVDVDSLTVDLVDADLAYEVGTTIGIPQPSADTPPIDVDQPAGDGAPSARRAAAMGVPATQVEGCRATIEIPLTGGTEAVLVRAGTEGTGFEPVVATPRTGDGTISFDEVALAGGPQLFAVEATSGEVRSSSAPVLVSGADGCGGTWDSELRVEHGALRGVPDDIEQVFFFVGTGGAWRRVPADGQAMLSRTGGGFDVRAAMPDVSSATAVEIEVWGTRAGALVDLGRSRFVPDSGFDPAIVIGRSRGSSLALITSPDGVTPEESSVDEWLAEPGVSRFRWSSSIAGTTHAMWQVLTFAPTPNTSPLTSGVVAQGQLDGSNGTFELDIGALIEGPPQLPELTSTMPAYASIAGPAAGTATRTEEALPTGGVEPAGGAEGFDVASTTDLLLPPLENIHIRVIPMVGEQWPGTATNNVLIRSGDPTLADLTEHIDMDKLGEPIDPEAVPYELTATILPPTPPNPGYANCWEFVKWDETTRALNFLKVGQYEWWDGFLASIGPTTPICPGPCYHLSSSHRVSFGGSNCGGGGLYIPVVSEFASLVVELWDMIVTGFNAIKAFVVDSIVTLSGCTAYASKAFCSSVATLAVNAVLAVYGIPPSLPNSEQLKQIAKGELKDIVLDAAQDLGVPCAEFGTAITAAGADEISCDALIEAALDQVEREVGAFFAEAARQSAGISFPPGAVVRPAPLGQTGPAIVTMALTPTPGAPTVGGVECTAQITMLASWSPPDPGATFSQFFGAAGAVPHGSPVRLPNYQIGAGSAMSPLDVWAVPARAYDGFVSIQHVALPTDDLAFTPGTPVAPTSRTYFPALWYTDPVEGALLGKDVSSQQERWRASYWSKLPYHALQLHSGAEFIAEIYSPCTGLYRYENPILGLFGGQHVGTFEKVP